MRMALLHNLLVISIEVCLMGIALLLSEPHPHGRFFLILAFLGLIGSGTASHGRWFLLRQS